MKTAVSIPDDIFKAADTAAKKLGISRSELFVRALREMLDYRDGESVTEALNRVYSDDASQLDPVLARMQNKALPEEDW